MKYEKVIIKHIIDELIDEEQLPGEIAALSAHLIFDGVFSFKL